MTRRPRALAGHLIAIVVGTLIGTLIASAAASIVQNEDLKATPPPSIALSPIPTASASLATAVDEQPLLLAWASGGLPLRAERVLEALPYVERATTVRTGTDWVRRPSSEFPGAAIPLEVALVKPREYARFIAPAERAALLALGPGETMLADSAALHESQGERSLGLIDRTLRIRGTIDDVAAGGYEALIAGEVPASWSRVDRFLLVQLREPAARTLVEAKLRGLLGPGRTLRVRARGETPFLRYGDAVLPQLLIKKTFGEFAARPLPSGTIHIDPDWIRRNIRTASVPVLGRVTCHRALIPQLTAALGELEAEGLAHTVDTSEYGGCFGPRFIGLEPRGRLSHHAWGIAIDINVAANAFGTKSDQDPRLVQIMEQHGFTWGGRWLVPDAMHFEWVEFP